MSTGCNKGAESRSSCTDCTVREWRRLNARELCTCWTRLIEAQRLRASLAATPTRWGNEGALYWCPLRDTFYLMRLGPSAVILIPTRAMKRVSISADTKYRNPSPPMDPPNHIQLIHLRRNAIPWPPRPRRQQHLLRRKPLTIISDPDHCRYLLSCLNSENR